MSSLSVNKKFDYLSKVVIVGDSAVGKTNILLRFTEDNYRMLHNSTIGVDFKIKTVNVNNKRVKLTLWDTAGQDRFRTITSNYYKGSDAVIFTYSISDRNSFQNMESWINNFEENSDK
jgi:small GTP-binding protein